MMNRHHTRMIVLAGAVAFQSTMLAGGRSIPAAIGPSAVASERHHYSLSARVRPLLVFWIRCSDVGDAVVTKRRGWDQSGYSLLIGSDPERAPRRINRWGYIAEEIHGGEADLIGLMTESDEQSVDEADAHLRQQPNGGRTYQVIQATIHGDRARSVVTPLDVPTAYSFRELRMVLDLARQESPQSNARVVQIPEGTRPGFLHALADLVHQHVQAFHGPGGIRRGPVVTYVYHGRLYQLRATRAEAVSRLRVGATAYRQVVAADFEIRNTYTGELTPFSMTYGVDGPFAEVPLTASYQPRWWMQVDLALDDTTSGPQIADRVRP
jgi:hypothetical protein